MPPDRGALHEGGGQRRRCWCRSPGCSRSRSGRSRSRASRCARGARSGEIVSSFLVADFSRTGAYILCATALFVALILATQFSFSTFLHGAGSRVGARLRRAADRLGPLPRDPAQGEDAARRHPQAHRRPGRRRGPAADPPGRRPRTSRRPRRPDPDDLPLNAPVPRAAAPAQRPLPFAAAADAPADEEAEARRPGPPPVAGAPARAAEDRGRCAGTTSSPPSTILDEAKGGSPVDNDRLLEKGRILQAKCSEFGVMGTVKEIHPGPVVTTYEFKPDAGIKYSKIVGLADDLALALEAESIRVDRVSGKGNVGIEIPNEARETIYLREILESDTFRRSSGRLTLGLGKAVNGDVWITDLAAMPHLLIAGSTGTGKSVGPQLHDRLDPLPGHARTRCGSSSSTRSGSSSASTRTSRTS